jgi:membrane-associated phospholipid phosphatase
MTLDGTTLKEAADAVQEADAVVADSVEPLRKTPAVRLVALLSELGDQPQMRALSGAVIAAGVVGRDRRLVRAGLRMLASHELATAIKNAVKHRVDRTRPRSRDETADAHKIQPGDDQSKEETSFPSGHSAGAASVARAFVREYPEHALSVQAAAGGIALAQIPRCAHYPSDVGAGLAIGAASELIVDGAWRLLAGAADRS